MTEVKVWSNCHAELAGQTARKGLYGIMEPPQWGAKGLKHGVPSSDYGPRPRSRGFLLFVDPLQSASSWRTALLFSNHGVGAIYVVQLHSSPGSTSTVHVYTHNLNM